jgi:hypothetical protein
MTDIFYHKITLLNQAFLIELKINTNNKGDRLYINDYYS